MELHASRHINALSPSITNLSTPRVPGCDPMETPQSFTLTTDMSHAYWRPFVCALSQRSLHPPHTSYDHRFNFFKVPSAKPPKKNSPRSFADMLRSHLTRQKSKTTNALSVFVAPRYWRTLSRQVDQPCVVSRSLPVARCSMFMHGQQRESRLPRPPTRSLIIRKSRKN